MGEVTIALDTKWSNVKTLIMASRFMLRSDQLNVSGAFSMQLVLSGADEAF